MTLTLGLNVSDEMRIWPFVSEDEILVKPENWKGASNVKYSKTSIYVIFVPLVNFCGKFTAIQEERKKSATHRFSR